MNAVVDLVGKAFGRLIVLSRDEYRGGNSRWLCRCDCGQISVVRSNNLKSGHTTSCGCSHIEHGHAVVGKRSPEFVCWDNMVRRCKNPNHDSYKDYGGRGITVCKRWLKFKNFLADMGLRPAPHLTLERLENEKGYSLDNCVWANQSDQNRNRRPYKWSKEALARVRAWRSMGPR